MKSIRPLNTIELFPPLSQKLSQLLRSLGEDDWSKPTACALWTVKDIAAHLLGGSLGRLTHSEEEPSQSTKNELSFEQLVRLIDQENDEWIKAARRINPTLLIEYLEIADAALYMHFKSLPMDAIARTPVSWAGELESPNWMDIAREYTEKWLHQQQIWEAVGRPLLTAHKWLHPVLDTFVRALPYTYHDFVADDGTSLMVHVTGPAGGKWCLLRQPGAWQLYSGTTSNPAARVEIDQDLAWRLFTKGISPGVAHSQVKIEGMRDLGERFLNTVSIMG